MNALDSPIKNMNALETTTRIQGWEGGGGGGGGGGGHPQNPMRFHNSITKSNAKQAIPQLN